jgi:phospholipid/cholesterol/gamma-HCH transport system substrate-binding protein
MNPNLASTSTRIKVGLFVALGLVLTAVVTVAVNDRPFWWRSCHLETVSVEDATGLKFKSPVRSLGIQIGYINSVELSGSHVRLGICITAPVERIPETRAYLRGEGFLGDQFLELKPVRPLFGRAAKDFTPPVSEPSSPVPSVTPSSKGSARREIRAIDVPADEPKEGAWVKFWDFLIPSAAAAPQESDGKEIPVAKEGQNMQKLVEKVNDLVGEMTQLTSNLKQGIQPDELRKTMQQLNRTLENASKTLSPEGNLTMTARRALLKLEDSIDQMRQIITRINEGKGSIGMMINDPSYAEEIKLALKNINKLLNKVSDVRFVVDVGGEMVPAYDGSRGWFRLGVWPNPTRYYLLGLSIDPRGKVGQTTTSTQAGGTTSTVKTTQVEKGGFSITAMVGKRFFSNRFDLALGVLHGDGAASVSVLLGPSGSEESLRIINDVYGRSTVANGDTETKIDVRSSLYINPFSAVYIRGGVDGYRRHDGKIPFSAGAGIQFDDEDIKLLFSLK